MKNEWINRLQKSVIALWNKPQPQSGPDPLVTRVEDLDRAMARLAREQAKSNVELDALNRSQEQLAADLSKVLRRLDEASQRGHHSEASAREEGIRQGYQAARAEAVHGIIGMLDGLHNAIGIAREARADLAWLEGLEAVMQRGEDVLSHWGVEPTSAPGLVFDPDLHEAIGSRIDNAVARPLIAEEVLRGYRQGKQILRAAKVVVLRHE